MSDLEQAFHEQENFQRSLYGGLHPADFPVDQRIQYIKDMVLAISNELQAEVLGEIGWKPWATSRHINVDPAKGEMNDVFCFFLNLCLSLGMTAEELLDGHADKMIINRRRQLEGYTGTEKCPDCRRAYDDPSTLIFKLGKWYCACGRELAEARP